ncbi:radical SAM protein [Planctomycetota bacterium]
MRSKQTAPLQAAFRRRVLRTLSDWLVTAGVLDGGHAFVGPQCVQIDLTNHCNNRCIACWCRSPLLGTARISPAAEAQELPWRLVDRTLRELAAIGTREIIFSGGGEPTLYPGLFHAIAVAKQHGMHCALNTNFVAADRSASQRLASSGLDHLTVSLWAAAGETYAVTHPGRTAEDFSRITARVGALRRQRGRRGRPRIKIHNVLMPSNWRETGAMVSLARRLGVDEVEFSLVDPVAGATDSLLLSDGEVDLLLVQIEALRTTHTTPPAILNLADLTRRLRCRGRSHGRYDEGLFEATPCTIGWTFARVLADGKVAPCLKAHRAPCGNLHESGFSDIWFGPAMNTFRRLCSDRAAADPFWRRIGNRSGEAIGCELSCDNLDRNRAVTSTTGRREKILSRRPFSVAAKLLLRTLQPVGGAGMTSGECGAAQ